MLEQGYLHGDCMTVTGKTMGEVLPQFPGRPGNGLVEGQTVIGTFQKPIKPTGHIAVLSGNLAPGFAFGKITGKEGTIFRGPARCFDQEEDMMEAVAADAQSLKGCVIVIRYEGPKGGPGMKEMLNPTALVMGATRTRCPRVPPADEASPPRAYQRTALRGQLALVPPVVPHRLHRRAPLRAQHCLWPRLFSDHFWPTCALSDPHPSHTHRALSL